MQLFSRYFISLLMLLVFVPTALANKKMEESKQDLNEVKEKIESLKKELDSAQSAHKDAADALKESETAISVANRKLFEINNIQQQNKKKLSKLESESLSTSQALSAQQQLLSKQLYQQYTQGQQNYAQMILQNEKPSAIAQDVQYFSYVAKARAQLISDMQNNLNKISALNTETASALKEVAVLKQKQLEEKQALESQKKAKSKVVVSLSQQISAQRNEIEKLKRDEQNLSNLVERLAKIIPPKKVAKKRVKPKTTPIESNKTTQPSDVKPSDAKPTEDVIENDEEPSADETPFSGENFAALKGKLRLPVRGEVVNRFGSTRADSGISWKGLFIRASEGAEVKSIASGQVVFADWLRGFGNLIILDHGNGYMSLYGNNQAVLKQVGDTVSTGDTIASVGNSGGNETNGLYYELRRKSKPFDPMSWSRLN